MARIHYYQWVQSHVSGGTSLAVAAGATVYVYLAGTTTQASIFNAVTGSGGGGGDATLITQPIIADASGYFEFWIDDSDYDFQTQKFKIVIAKTGYTGITIDNIDAQFPPNNLLSLRSSTPYIRFNGEEDYGPTYDTKQGSVSATYPDPCQVFRIIEENGVFKIQYNIGDSITDVIWADILSYSMWGRIQVHQKGFLRIPGLTDELEGLKARLLHVESLAHTA